MRVLIAPDRYRQTLTAAEASTAIAAGWRRVAPDDELVLLPLSDGSAGLVAAVSGRFADHRPADGPAGGPAEHFRPPDGPAEHFRPADGPAEPWFLAADGTAFVESAQVSPLAEDPGMINTLGQANTLGVGALVAAAVDAGARRVVVGLGEVGAIDGGAGLLAGLAAAWNLPGSAQALERLGAGGAALRGVTAADLAVLPGLRERLAGVELIGAVDVQLPLLGFKGAAAVEGPGKGADADLVQRLDAALTDLAAAAIAAAGLPDRTVAEGGSGAGGGLGFGVLALGGRLEAGATLIAGLLGLPDLITGRTDGPDSPGSPDSARGNHDNRADLVVTGEGLLDWQSLGSKVVSAVAGMAQERGVPTVAVPGQLQVGRRELLTLGIDGAYPVARTPADVVQALADPATSLSRRAERVARTWSR